MLCLLEQVVEKLPGGEVCAITVASQRDGMAFLDREGKELYCAPNMDLRGGAILSELEPFRKELLGRTGLPLHALFGLPRLLWYSRFMPRAYEKIDCVMMLCDWLAFRLSGERRSERAAASSSQMLNLKTGEYDGELMELLGLRSDIFPRACSGTEVIGNLLPEAAKRIGLPSGIPVLIGGSDTHCGLVGMNCMRTGEMGVVAGTTTPVVSLLDRPMVDKAAVYTSCSAVDGQWAMEGNAEARACLCAGYGIFSSPDRRMLLRRCRLKQREYRPAAKGCPPISALGFGGKTGAETMAALCFPYPGISAITAELTFSVPPWRPTLSVCAPIWMFYTVRVR